eukprot:3497404-Prymnesium_polylepis.2
MRRSFSRLSPMIRTFVTSAAPVVCNKRGEAGGVVSPLRCMARGLRRSRPRAQRLAHLDFVYPGATLGDLRLGARLLVLLLALLLPLVICGPHRANVARTLIAALGRRDPLRDALPARHDPRIAIDRLGRLALHGV